jgi:hypothetical protein
MQGQSLTSSELKASLSHRIAHLVARGADRAEATRILAIQYGIRPERLAALVEPVKGGEA